MTNKPLTTEQKIERLAECSVNECSNRHLARGFCSKHYNSEYRRKNGRGKDRGYYLKNRDRILAKQKVYRKTEKGKEVAYRGFKKWCERNPEKRWAHEKVKYALRRGDLQKHPCKCGEETVEAHHEDHTKPLEVTWLCKRCHESLHHSPIQK